MTQGERIKYIRTNIGGKKMTLEQFGKRIGLKTNSLSQIENGKNNVTEQTLKLICSEFNVNEEWLRYEKGEPFYVTDTDLIEALTIKYHLDPLGKAFIKNFLELDADDKKAIEKFLYKTFSPQNIDYDMLFEDGSILQIETTPPQNGKKK